MSPLEFHEFAAEHGFAYAESAYAAGYERALEVAAEYGPMGKA